MENYFIYFPQPEKPSAWGAAVTSVGFTDVPPGAEYPPRGAAHPGDHLFAWNRGRILDRYQVIFITAGTGVFESRETGRREVGAGTLILLFPGVWHRYKPNPDTGWVENWIEVEGEVPDKLRRERVLDPRCAVMQPGLHPALTELMNECHGLAQNRPAGYASRLATATLHLLAAALDLAAASERPLSPMDKKVRQAQAVMAERCGQPFSVEALAQELGVSASHFRAAFQAHTGFAPRQYHIRLRLRQVQNLLRNSSLSLKEIANQLGYSSAAHLSTEFKSVHGVSPALWRRNAAQSDINS